MESERAAKRILVRRTSNPACLGEWTGKIVPPTKVFSRESRARTILHRGTACRLARAKTTRPHLAAYWSSSLSADVPSGRAPLLSSRPQSPPNRSGFQATPFSMPSPPLTSRELVDRLDARHDELIARLDELNAQIEAALAEFGRSRVASEAPDDSKKPRRAA
jgi:hypothetical protein